MISILLEGGMANQMWQTAFLIAYAKKHGLDYCVPTKVNNPHIPGKEAYRFPGVVYHNDPPPLKSWIEPHFHYAEIPPMDNVCFEGYFQSWRYFDEYREEVLKAFELPWEMNKGVVSIHVRRTDYLKWPQHHPVVSEAYLGKAVYFFAQRGYFKFKVFSDDIEWCKENLPMGSIQLEFSEGKDEIEDLIEASSCEHNLGSNSAFSWWIHYLNQNKNKMGTFPIRWFGPDLPHDTKDLYLPTSVIL